MASSIPQPLPLPSAGQIWPFAWFTYPTYAGAVGAALPVAAGDDLIYQATFDPDGYDITSEGWTYAPTGNETPSLPVIVQNHSWNFTTTDDQATSISRDLGARDVILYLLLQIPTQTTVFSVVLGGDMNNGINGLAVDIVRVDENSAPFAAPRINDQVVVDLTPDNNGLYAVTITAHQGAGTLNDASFSYDYSDAGGRMLTYLFLATYPTRATPAIVELTARNAR